MQIAILGAGRIGSAFAHRLARAGHEVTVVARGARLTELEREGAIVDSSGDRGSVTAISSLGEIAYDAVLVTVLAHQLEAALPALRACAAKKIVFLLNTFATLDHLRGAVGPARAVFGFPVFIADFEGGKLRSEVEGPGQGVTIDDPTWADVFRGARIPSKVERDMESWLRAHVALIAPIMAAGRVAHARPGGLTWPEAMCHASALDEGFAIVRALGHRVIPGAVGALAHLPHRAKAGIVWVMSRARTLQRLGEKGPEEPRALLDAMIAAAPAGTSTEALQTLRRLLEPSAQEGPTAQAASR